MRKRKTSPELDRALRFLANMPTKPTSAPGSEGGYAARHAAINRIAQAADEAGLYDEVILPDEEVIRRRESEIADLKRQLAEAERKGWNEAIAAVLEGVDENDLRYNFICKLAKESK